MDKKPVKIKDKKEEGLIKFLCLTKEGKYASVDVNSLSYARIEEETQDIEPYQETYYYGLS